MIIIIRTLSHDQNKSGQRSSPNKIEAKEAYKKKRKKIKKREKREGTTLLSFYHTCASEYHHVLHIESLLSYHFHILVGIFIVELGLYIPTMGFLKCPRTS